MINSKMLPQFSANKGIVGLWFCFRKSFSRRSWGNTTVTISIRLEI